MTKQEIIDTLTSLSEFSYPAPIPNTSKKKNALIVSNRLMKNGAPMALLSYLRALKEEYDFFVIGMGDGELRPVYEAEGFSVHLGVAADYNNDSFLQILDEMDFLLCSTVVTAEFVCFAYQRTIPTIWWIHEAYAFLSQAVPYVDIDHCKSDNIRIVASSKTAKQDFETLYGLSCGLLHVRVEDRYQDRNFFHDCGKPVTFFMPASMEYIKGPDVLAKAILKLPASYMARSRFIFAGPGDSSQPQYLDMIKKLDHVCDNVQYLGILSHDDVFEVCYQSDCVIAPSRTDSLPATIIEGMVFADIGICSDAAGISAYIDSGVNGYVFESENVEQLREVLMHIIDHVDELFEVRIQARALYENCFSPDACMRQIRRLLPD